METEGEGEMNPNPQQDHPDMMIYDSQTVLISKGPFLGQTGVVTKIKDTKVYLILFGKYEGIVSNT